MGLFLTGILLGIGITLSSLGSIIELGITGDDLIEECQYNLPRDTVCELEAVSKSKD